MSGLDEIICLDALKEIASRWNADVGILQNLLDSAQEVQAPSAGRGAVPNERQGDENDFVSCFFVITTDFSFCEFFNAR